MVYTRVVYLGVHRVVYIPGYPSYIASLVYIPGYPSYIKVHEREASSLRRRVNDRMAGRVRTMRRAP